MITPAADRRQPGPWKDDPLGWLLGSVSPSDFFRDAWERRPLHVSRSDAGYYGALFSRDEVEAIITTTPVQSRYELGTVRNRERRPVAANSEGLGDLGGVSRAYSDGHTVIGVHIEERSLQVARLCRALESRVHFRVLANLYLTPPREQGFRIHWDNHDTFILQIDGAKRWHVWNPIVTLPLKQTPVRVDPDALGAPAADVRLEAGDLFYVPRGFPHEALTEDRSSLHLTFGLFPDPWVTLLQAALEIASEGDVELRKSLPVGFLSANNEREALASRFGELVTRFAASADFDAAAARIRTRTLQWMAPATGGHLASLDLVAQLDADTRVRRPLSAVCVVEVGDTSATIRFAGNQVSGPASIAPTLRFIAESSTPFSARDLPGDLPLTHRRDLVARLITEALLVVDIVQDDASGLDVR